MSVVKINAITVTPERMEEFAERFAKRAGRVESAEGFEGFELLRPNDERDVCLVLTRWRSEQDFQAWMKSADFSAGHSTCSSGSRSSRDATRRCRRRSRRRPAPKAAGCPRYCAPHR
jgi:heme oxygenase (mycobilin-producing)